MKDETIQTGEYSQFNEAMSKVDNLNSALGDVNSQMQGYANSLGNESIFAGPICENCVEELNKVSTSINSITTNFLTIKSYLDKSLVNYKDADASAITYLDIKDGKIIETNKPMSNNQTLADSLAKELGKRSGDFGDSPVGFHSGQWCADFVSYMLRKNGYNLKWSSIAGDDSGIFSSLREQGAEIHYDEFGGRRGKKVDKNYVPQAGDVVLMNNDSDSSIDHVGFVIKDNGDGTITTIEGNTSKNGGGYNGGYVEKKIRKRSEMYGYATPVKNT